MTVGTPLRKEAVFAVAPHHNQTQIQSDSPSEEEKETRRLS